MTHEVIQADRNAAVRLLEAVGQDWAAKDIRIGNGDYLPIVQAFAAHRIEAERRIVEINDRIDRFQFNSDEEVFRLIDDLKVIIEAGAYHNE